MSRVGRAPIAIPDQVKVACDGQRVTVTGPKGDLTRTIHNDVRVDVKDDSVRVSLPQRNKKAEGLQGLTRTLLANMITGVTKGFERTLEVHGVGYRVDLKSDVLTFTIGYSHPVVYQLPHGITASINKNRVVLAGIDKEQLGEAAATIRNFRKPEPYKGKGIRYVEEDIRRKVGKSGAKQ